MTYTATKWNTAEDKAKFVKKFIKFVEKDFPQTMFDKKFYARLSMMFGHIAHYDVNGFWKTFFTNATDKIRFLEQTLNYPCYGDPTYTWSDAEKEIQGLLEEMEVLEKWQRIEAEENDSKERAEYQRLKKKFELPLTSSKILA
jgi:hypothetical protein